MAGDDRVRPAHAAAVCGHVAHEGEPPHVPRQARQAGEERVQPLDGRQVPDEQQLEGAALAAFLGDETLGG